MLSPLQKNHVLVKGNPDSEKVLLLAHGYGSDQTAWKHFIPVFEEDYKIVLFDMVGSGKSAIEAYSHQRYDSLQAYANDILDICDTLNLRNIIYVGHSVSCMLGVLAGIKAPELFDRFIFIGGSPRYLNDLAYQGGFDRVDLDNIFNAMASNYHSWVSGFAPIAMGHADHPGYAREFARTLKTMRPDIALSTAKLIFQSDCRNELHKFYIPTLIIQSTNDIAVPEAVGQYLHQHLRQSKLVKIKAEGHLPHISAADEVIQVIQHYLDTQLKDEYLIA